MQKNILMYTVHLLFLSSSVLMIKAFIISVVFIKAYFWLLQKFQRLSSQINEEKHNMTYKGEK